MNQKARGSRLSITASRSAMIGENGLRPVSALRRVDAPSSLNSRKMRMHRVRTRNALVGTQERADALGSPYKPRALGGELRASASDRVRALACAPIGGRQRWRRLFEALCRPLPNMRTV